MPTNPPITADRLRRFFEKTVFIPPVACRVWIGGANEHGYGIFWNGERLEKAHRFALRAAGVYVPRDMDVLHSCDFPPCVNPEHFSVGTTQANVDDMWAKARATVQHRRGTAQTQAKLDDEKVARIRALWATGGWRQRDLAAEFGVSQSLVWRVIHWKNWKAPSGLLVERGRGR